MSGPSSEDVGAGCMGLLIGGVALLLQPGCSIPLVVVLVALIWKGC